ncbi:probable RNA binding protein Rpf2 involved in ribosome biogenesis [Cephalotrichum gorgonifer]|uniref:Ribosome production factor 2 homolog n=1 Tax=Cephalotrichum gorgonifer TaxID=2041049 RepID=A0AAE8SUH2_9PEZI|nr:probable RNA binding protein Rpf2 involved in ribosome biogenesis [Cephalotrichum gorgonifer]
MLRTVKPRNARSKRALENREPKAIENPKTALFLRGTTCSQVVQDAMTDLHSLRAPYAKRFSKKNALHPFEDASSLEFFSEKNDASLFVFGATSKKRPHSLTFVRMFGHKVLDMLEVYLDPESFRRMNQFKGRKPATGLRPMVVFAGSVFDSPIENEYTLAKSMFTDFFAGRDNAEKIDVEGLQFVVSITAEDPISEEEKPRIHIRVYLNQTKRSGQKLPRVEVEEMGPRMDFRVGRVKEADVSMLKEAMKKARTTEERPKKNITTDIMGDKIGRIHLGRQDMSKLQTRRVKGLKRGRDEVVAGDEEDVMMKDDESKRPRV